MSDDKVLVMWLTAGYPIHFDSVWNYEVDKSAIRFNYKDSSGRIMNAEFDLSFVAGCALGR